MHPTTIATLYTFASAGGGSIKVVRLTYSLPKDWHTWHERYAKTHPNIEELEEIGAIEFVDERNAT
jgi:hypothetical protein